MKITAIKATSHLIPLSLPLVKEPEMENILSIRVETDEGINGFGVFSNRGNRPGARFMAAGVRDFINYSVSPLLIGMDPVNTEAISDIFIKTFDSRSMTGIMVNILSGLDIAMWDIKGKLFRQPVYKLLGGYSPRVPVYATFGLISYSREELVEVARMRLSSGHDKLKMLVCINNSKNIPEDAARVKTVREAIGDKPELMVDVNQRFDLSQATELCQRIQEYKIGWVEEPVAHNDIRGMAMLRTRTTIPISAGQESHFSWQHRLLIASGSIDIDQPDIVNVGGFTEGIKVAHVAQSFDMPIALHGLPQITIHLAAAVPNGWRVEFHARLEALGEIIFINPPKPEGGWVTCPDKAGFGLEINDDALKQYQDKV